MTEDNNRFKAIVELDIEQTDENLHELSIKTATGVAQRAAEEALEQNLDVVKAEVTAVNKMEVTEE